MQLIEAKTILYKDRYNCVVPNYKKLYKIFKEECDKYGILYNMEDIIKAFKKENNYTRIDESLFFFVALFNCFHT